MILTMLEIGMSCRIRAVRGNDAMKKYLGGLGFVAGAEVSVVAENGGDFIVCVKEARIALGKQLAARILLEGPPSPGSIPCPAKEKEVPAALLADL